MTSTDDVKKETGGSSDNGKIGDSYESDDSLICSTDESIVFEESNRSDEYITSFTLTFYLIFLQFIVYISVL